MNTPSFSPPVSRGRREGPYPNCPTSCVRPPAKENRLGNGRYSPKGTRCTLSYRATQSPLGLTSAAELYTGPAAFGLGASLPTDPVTIHNLVARAMLLT